MEEQKWLLEYERSQDILEEAQEERQSVSEDDVLIVPQITEQEELSLLAELHLNKKVKEVWVVQKQIKHFQESPIYVVTVVTSGFIYNKEAWFEKLTEGYDAEHSVYLTSSSTNSALTKKVKQHGLELFS